MNNQQAMLTIARINKCSKHIIHARNLGLSIDVGEIEEDLKIISSVARELRLYVNAHITEKILESITVLPDEAIIADYIAHKLSKAVDVRVKQYLDKLAATLKFLKIIAKTFSNVTVDDQYAGLADDFHSEDALSAFQKAVEAGFLTNDYAPKNLSLLQMKYLATAISQYANIPARRKWVVFGIQWKRMDFKDAPLVKKRDTVIEKIKKTFPRADFDSLTEIKTENYFVVTNSEDDILSLFTALIINRYVDPRTKYEDFMKVFGIGDMSERTPVNWIGEQKEFCAFIYLAFSTTNFRIWGRACQCFVIKGKPIHRPTLKSQCNLIKRKEVDYPYYKKIKAICSEFNRNVAM